MPKRKIQTVSPSDAIKILIAKGFTLSSISRYLGKPSNYVSRINSGAVRDPGYKTVDKLRELVCITGGQA